MAEDKKPATKKAATKKATKKDEVVETPQTVQPVVEAPAGEDEVLDFTTVEDAPVAEAPKVEEAKEEIPVEVIAQAETMPEVIQVPDPAKELSRQAKGWKSWLEYQRMTPEQFLKQYPSHKMRHLIQEILDHEAKK